MSSTERTPIARSGNSFSDQVERALRQQILRGRHEPGARLNEVEIATELGVSRGPVREAMQRLARDGLVELQAHRGAFVRRLGPGEVRDLFEVRVALERTVAGLAAERATPEQRRQLAELRGTTTAIGDPAPPDVRFQGPRDVHALLATAAGNAALASHVVLVNQELQLLRAQSGQIPDRAEHAIHEHDDLIDAVLAGDAPRAAAAMELHLGQALEHALRSMEPAD
ncbi:GntR family transcriptional regulator [Patulibacter minatonensis]|uniref:GntR family transcriptional regulator n=1 Tax=Patulibacter minatonensis TaxID=298163 RepID=UPI000687FC3B|nr:GntR family transcriptional regulator [Patulibacter minatonensis]